MFARLRVQALEPLEPGRGTGRTGAALVDLRVLVVCVLNGFAFTFVTFDFVGPEECGDLALGFCVVLFLALVDDLSHKL